VNSVIHIDVIGVHSFERFPQFLFHLFSVIGTRCLGDKKDIFTKLGIFLQEFTDTTFAVTTGVAAGGVPIRTLHH
jgi:hypothetical protein